MYNRELAKLLNVSVRSVIRKARELNIDKEPGFLEKRRDEITKMAIKAHPPQPTKGKKGWSVPNSGPDIEIFTPEQAKEQGMKMQDFANIPNMKIKASEIVPVRMIEDHKTGKEERRDRRARSRKSKPKNKKL